MTLSELQHLYNGLHYKCRLIERGLNEECARLRAREWEEVHWAALYGDLK